MKKAEGNPGKRPLNESEPKPATGDVKPPSWMTSEGKRVWNELTPELKRLGLVTKIDVFSFATACENFATWVRCQQFFRSKDPVTKKPRGMTFTTPNGYVQQRPEVAIGQKALAEARAWFIEFGLTPAARTRLDVTPAPDEDDPMEALLSGVGDRRV